MERLTGKTLAYMRCCRAALPHLRKSGGGRVICIGGSAARHAGATALPSALGNSSIIAFVNQFSKTVAAQGITANVVHPPFTKTDRYPKRLTARAKQLGVSEAEAEKSFIKQFPIGRLVGGRVNVVDAGLSPGPHCWLGAGGTGYFAQIDHPGRAG
jgi:NAD(P)-dependent dehydrogenase (short-subunit alcohol dehydrogenase family)